MIISTMYPVRSCVFVVLLLLFKALPAQNYQAIKGSSYAGSLSVADNPASIVHVPYSWDVTPLAFQFKQTTNAFRIEDYSYLSAPGKAEMMALNGTKKRYFYAAQDIHLLNTRINIGASSAIAFGANLRGYQFATSSQSDYQDTIATLGDYMEINAGNQPLSARLAGSAWGELYASYARTILDQGDRILNAGLTLKFTRALGGGYGRLQDASYLRASLPAPARYLLTSGSLQYGYSANFDGLDSSKSNTRAFLRDTYSGWSADLGLEYILFSDNDKEDAGDYGYSTKIGFSIMDIGSDKFRHGSRSRLATAGLPAINDTLIEAKISTVGSFDDFNDSLSQITRVFNELGSDFVIYKPTRLLISVDQHIRDNIFINAGLTIPVINLAGNNSLFIKQPELLAITPRWELRSLGAYLPFLVNSRGKAWIGAAFKAGPLLVGTHNLGSLFSKDRTQNGGVYLALTIRPWNKGGEPSRYSETKLSGRSKRLLSCPKF
jgi:hypothetical protein